jgi:hypothetical protein
MGLIHFEAVPCALCSGDYAAHYDGERFERNEDPWRIEHTTPACPASQNLAPRAFLRANHVAKGFYR